MERNPTCRQFIDKSQSITVFICSNTYKYCSHWANAFYRIWYGCVYCIYVNPVITYFHILFSSMCVCVYMCLGYRPTYINMNSLLFSRFSKCFFAFLFWIIISTHPHLRIIQIFFMLWEGILSNPLSSSYQYI